LIVLPFVIMLAIGLAAGAFSGLLGIGGGIIIVPALVAGLGFTQKLAQGTTLAMLVLPIGLLGAIEYSRQGLVDWKVMSWIAVGFLIGNLFGARLALLLPTPILKKIFGIVMMLIGLKMLTGI
jgi:uncharacterized protein